MKIETKEIKAGRASRVVVVAAIAAMGAGALATPAFAIQDNGRMVEENALELRDKLGGQNEDGFYIGTGFFGPFKAAYVLFHKGLIFPVQVTSKLRLPREGYKDQ